MKFKDNIDAIVEKIKSSNISGLNIKISPEQFLIYTFLVLLSGLLLINIYKSISDIQNYTILDKEKGVLKQLEDENRRLQKEKEYYESSYYRKLYAREYLSLAKETQDIFVVERKKDLNLDQYEKNPDPILKDNLRFWWKKLIL